MTTTGVARGRLVAPRRKVLVVLAWAVQIVLAAVFLGAGLAAVMVGASVVNAVVLDVSPLATLALLGAASAIAWIRRDQARAALPVLPRR